MASNWIILQEDDVLDFMSQTVVGAAAELDKDGNSRVKDVLPVVTDRIRDAITTGNRTQLSLTKGSIPAGARWHALCLAVYALVESQPALAEFALKDGFTRRWEEAERWVRRVESGQQPVTPPTDPDPDTGPVNTWGDVKGPSIGNTGSLADLSTDDAAEPLVNPVIIDGGGP